MSNLLRGVLIKLRRALLRWSNKAPLVVTANSYIWTVIKLHRFAWGEGQTFLNQKSWSGMKRKSETRRIQTTILILASAAFLITGMIVGLANLASLYGQWKEHHEQELMRAVLAKTSAIEAFLDRAKDAALLVTSRAAIREKLEAYDAGELGMKELSAFTQDKLMDVIDHSKLIVGITRLDRKGIPVAHVGMSIPQDLWLVPVGVSMKAQIGKPVVLDGRILLVLGAPVFDLNMKRLGTDVVLSEITGLKTIVENSSDLAVPGEVFLGMALPQGPVLLSSGSSASVPQLHSVIHDSLIRPALDRALMGKSGIMSPQVSSQDYIAGYGPISDTNWGLVIRAGKDEIYGPVWHQLFLTGAIVVLTVILGAVGMVLILRPLTGKLILSAGDMEQEIREKTARLNTELSERKQAEKVIQQQNQFLNTILESLTYPLYIIDTNDHTILKSNQAALLTGITERSACYSVTHNGTVPCDSSNHPCPLDEVKKTRLPVVVEHIHKDINNESRYFEIHGYPIFDAEGSITHMIEYSLDISDRKKSQALLIQAEKFRAVADLTSGVAHNINNLLQAIMGNARLALMGLESGELSDIRQSLERIIDTSKHGAATVGRLRRFARTGDERALSKSEILDVSHIIKDACEIVMPLWQKSSEKESTNIDLTLEIKDGCFVKGRRFELLEALSNLIRNATEALAQRLHIRIISFMDRGNVMIKITDSGVGISQEATGRLFTPFFTTKCEVGAGLGLAISRSIIHGHGGEIMVDSIEGSGSTFTIRLPASEEVSKDSQVPLESFSTRPLKVLVIDDMEPTIFVIRQVLEKRLHTVLTAFSGEDGFKIFTDNAVDLVICDLGMPGMNGWQVGKAIVDFCANNDLPKPPFIILTGWEIKDNEKERISESGVDALIEKPVEIEQLLAVVTRVAHKSERNVTSVG
jgi:signal transduction histidine kinase